MSSKLSLIVGSVFITLAMAMPNGTPPPSVTPRSLLLCCASVVPSSNTDAMAVAALLGIVVPSGLTGDVGLTCVPVPDPVNCSASAVTCDDLSPGGLIAINCVRPTS
ncbi:hydrophobin 2 [Mycena filopes]|nr:hydrophobin 2 [Mycena filopes]